MLQRRFAICVESSLRSAMMRFLRSFAFEGRGLGLYFRPWRAENWRRLAIFGRSLDSAALLSKLACVAVRLIFQSSRQKIARKPETF